MNIGNLRDRAIDAIPLLVFAAIALVMMSVGGFQTPAKIMVVNAVLVIGTYVFIGNSGILSFGQVSFAAVGAYTTALLTMRPTVKDGLLVDAPEWLTAIQVPPLLGLLAGAVVAALVALLFSWPIMRLSGLSAGIATLAMLVIVQVTIGNASSITGGKNSLVAIPQDQTPWTLAMWLVIAGIAALAFQASPVGRKLRASREDEVAARSIGISVVAERRVGFVVSGALLGLGGGLYAQVLGSISADTFYFALTFSTLLMLVFGGIGSLFGALAGTALITVVGEALRQTEAGINLGEVTVGLVSGTRELVLGAIMLLTLFLMRNGVTGGRELSDMLRRRRNARAAQRHQQQEEEEAVLS